jgi:hypothetical protein
MLFARYNFLLSVALKISSSLSQSAIIIRLIERFQLLE